MTGAGPSAAPPHAPLRSSSKCGFDRLARPYRWLEYASFGPALSRCRFAWLDRLRETRRALVIGDGDGRFIARLLRSNLGVVIDSVDFSAAMLHRQRQRAGVHARRLCLHHEDARAFAPAGPYDLIATHFFLDCLDQSDLDGLVARVTTTCAPGACWVISEFDIPARGPTRPAARCVVGGLYLAFGLLAGLETRSLPAYAPALEQAGFGLEHERTTLAGLLRSQLWLRSTI